MNRDTSHDQPEQRGTDSQNTPAWRWPSPDVAEAAGSALWNALQLVDRISENANLRDPDACKHKEHLELMVCISCCAIRLHRVVWATNSDDAVGAQVADETG
jgi:hypothetical protein